MCFGWSVWVEADLNACCRAIWVIVELLTLAIKEKVWAGSFWWCVWYQELLNRIGWKRWQLGWDWLLEQSTQDGRKWWRTKSVLGCIFMYLETIPGSDPHEQSIKPKLPLMLSFQVVTLFCWVVRWKLDEKQNMELYYAEDVIVLNYSFIVLSVFLPLFVIL